MKGFRWNLAVFYVFVCSCNILVQAQQIKTGPCPSIPVHPNLDHEKYAGKWYEIEKTYAYYQTGMKCITAEYTNRLNGSLGVVNRGIFVIGNTPSSIQGLASVTNEQEKSKLIMRLNSVPIPANYWVIETDYDNYSVVFSCSSMFFGLIHTENLWVLSRTPTMDYTLRQQIYQKLDDKNVDRTGLQATDQQNCPPNHR